MLSIAEYDKFGIESEKNDRCKSSMEIRKKYKFNRFPRSIEEYDYPLFFRTNIEHEYYGHSGVLRPDRGKEL